MQVPDGLLCKAGTCILSSCHRGLPADNRLSGEVVRWGTGQEEDDLCHLFGLCDALEARPILLIFDRTRGEETSRVGSSGSDAVDVHIVGSQLLSQTTRVVTDSGLRCPIDDALIYRHMSGYRANVDEWRSALIAASREGILPTASDNKEGGGSRFVVQTGDHLLAALETRQFGIPVGLGKVVVRSS